MNRLHLSGTVVTSARYVTAEEARFLKAAIAVTRTWHDPRKATGEERTDTFEVRFYGPLIDQHLEDLVATVVEGAAIAVEGALTPVRGGGKKAGGVFVEVSDIQSVMVVPPPAPPPDRKTIIAEAMALLLYEPQDGDPDFEDMTLCSLSAGTGKD